VGRPKQLVVTGDFFQLPPVNKGGSAKYAFEAMAWNEAIQATVNLTQVFRQKDTGARTGCYAEPTSHRARAQPL
jgi:hypothetical protein